MVKNSPANAGDVKEVGSVPGLGRSPGGGDGNPLQHPCLENPMNREAWHDTEPGSGESVCPEWYTGTRKRDPFILIRLTRAIY